jgi:hypothetical protein
VKKRSLLRAALAAIVAAGVVSPATPAVAAEYRPQPILYIAAEPGCYSLTLYSKKKVPLGAPKRIFRVNCYSKHHYEIYWAGRMNTRPGNPIPESKESLNLCNAMSETLQIYRRDSRSYNFGPNESTVIGNWLPDKGPEAKRYPKRTVCMYGVSTTEYGFLKEISEPLVRGLE